MTDRNAPLAEEICTLAGLHRCPHAATPTYCGCGPDRCAAFPGFTPEQIAKGLTAPAYEEVKP